MPQLVPTPAQVLQSALQLGPVVRAHAAQGETERRLPQPVVNAFAEAGLLRLSVPRAFGGCQAELSEQLEIIEAVARHDGAAGWCVMIHATTSVVTGQLSDEAVGELFDDPDAAACGVYAPRGKATKVEGGYRVTGRWSFASGCEHSKWRAGGALLFDGARPTTDADGNPKLLLALFADSDTRVHDTWHVAGLRGTGSHDIEVEDAFVPDHRMVDPSAPPQREGVSFRMPLFGFLAAEVAAVALGIGRASIETFAELAAHKKPAGSKRVLAERSTTHVLVADAEAELRSGRAYLHEVVRACEATVRSGSALSLDDRAHLRLAASHAVRAATRAVDRMYEAGGGAALYDRSPLQRQFRDVHAATQHLMVAAGIRELVGRHLVGMPVDPRQL